MRRKGLGSKLVKKAITWAMVATMSLTTAMSSFATMTVYAEETVVENEDGSVTKTETSTDTTTNADGSTTTTETTTETTTSTSTEDVTSTPAVNVIVSETVTDGGTEYYVDGTQVADEITADTQGEQDHIVEELVVDEDATQVNHYVVDADGNYVTDENGNKIEVTDGTVIEQIEVVEKTDGALEDVNEEDIVFVKENEDGVKELVDAATEGATEYVEVENADDYADSVTINELTVTDAEGNETKQFVDDDLAKLLDDDDTTESENYTLETVYTVSVKDAEGKDTTVEVKASELGEDEVPETDAEGNAKFSVKENKTYSFTDKEGNTCAASGESVKVSKEQKTTSVQKIDRWGRPLYDWWGNPIMEEVKTDCYYATITDENGNETKVEVNENSVQTKTEGWGWYMKTTYSIATTSKTTYETTLGGKTYEVASENVKTETHYEVIDENGQTVMELTKEQYENRNVTSKDYAKVDDGYVVYGDDGETEVARFTEDEWKVITEAEVTYKKVTKMYYTTDANVEYTKTSFGEKGSELELEDTYYKLDVKLFKNTDGITYGKPTCTIDEATKEAVVSITYKLEDGTTGTLTRRVALKDFGKSNYATITIKYVPTYTTKEGFEFEVAVEKTTADSVVVETVKTTTTSKESQPAATGNSSDNPMLDTRLTEGKTAINDANSRSKVGHIDVRVDVDTATLASKGVTDAKVETLTMTIGNKNYTPGFGLEYRADHPGEYEYSFKVSKERDKVAGDKLVTVLAKITYKLNGEEKTLWYQTKVYPNINDNANNVCSGNTWAQLGSGMDKGFDFVISLSEINAAIEQQITTTTTTTNTTQSLKMTLGMKTSLTADEMAEVVSASLDEGTQKVDENLIKALMFVRLDGFEQIENGSTHYPKTEYSKDLAKGQVILLFSPNGYKVYGEIGDETVYGNILTFVEDGKENKYIPEIEKAYLENLTDEQKELIRNAVELEVEKQIEEQKKAIAESLFGEEYTEEQLATITWTIDQDAIDAAIEDVMANLAVRWYVLKEEADGNHIDGVIVTKKFTVEVNGEVIEIPEIIPGPTPTPVDPTPDTVTIDDGPVPMAAAPVQDAPAVAQAPVADMPAVLGATREDDAAVLGATRGTDYAVLGKRRRPETGDSMAIVLWAMSALGGAGTAGVSGAKLLKGRKKNK